MNAKHPFVLKLSIAQKLLLTASVNIVFMLVIGFYAIERINVIGTEIARIAEVDMPMATMVTSIETKQLQQSLYLERALRTSQHLAKNASAKHDYHFAADQFNHFGLQVAKTLAQSIKKVEQDIELIQSGDEKISRQVLNSLKQIQREHQDYQRHGSQLLGVVGVAQLDYTEHQLLFDKIEREEQHLELVLSQLTQRLTQFGVAAMEQSHRVEESALRGVIVIALAAVVLGLSISFFLIRYITQPICQINMMTRKVAQGQIDQQIEWDGSDEIADLAKSINQLIATLNQTADQMDAIAQGDFSFEIKPRSTQDRVGIALHEMKKQIFEGTRALEQSNSLNTGIVDTSQDAILTINSKGLILSCNKATLALFQYSLGELVGQKINKLMPAPFSMEHDGYLDNYQKSGIKKLIGFGRELIGLKKDGAIFPIALTVGEVVQQESVIFTGFIRDISKQKEYEASLKRINADLTAQSIVKNQLASITDLIQGATDPSALAEHTVSALAQMTDAGHGVFYIKEQDRVLRQLRLMGCYAVKSRNHVLAGITIGEGLVGQCAQDKKSILLSETPLDYIQINSALGQQAPQNILLTPVLFEQELVGVIELASFKPFTELHQSMLAQATDNIGVVINNLFSQQKTRQLLMQTQRQAEALREQQQELQSSNESLREQTQLLKVSEEELKQQSEELWVSNEELSQKQRSLTEQTRQIEASKADLTLKAEELLVASKYKSEFLANMSHELRTPLNSLLLLAKGLAQNIDGNLTLTQVQDANIIYDGGHTLLSLINDILDLSKVEAGKLSIHIEAMKIETLTTKLYNMFTPLAKSKGLIFEVEVDKHSPNTLISDGQRIEQILRNLVSNALKFTEIGSVKVVIKPASNETRFTNPILVHENTLAIEVIDTGVGIPQAKCQQIFEAFVQQDGSTSRQFGGTGLGLTIARELSRLMGGEIQLTSQPGKGSTFTLLLPYIHGQMTFEDASNLPHGIEITDQTVSISQSFYTSQSPEQLITPDNPAAVVFDGLHDHPIVEDGCENESEDEMLQGRKILLADDDMRNTYALSKKLIEIGFEVQMASNGKEALELLNANSDFELVLMDIMMPIIDGIQATERIRKMVQYQHIPIIALTAKTMPEDRERCLRAGASEYITKPIDFDTLLSIMRIWLFKRV